ncbi:response regulator [Aliikangiella sp. G2MR2-5]|uniref:response regulator n=1 Tax=Aliikangiella sp. G2MR2-5 TaxID=2788943 RepID=UPI0018AC7738|nr:response regulator [Aliikangiella sp. G2MR2-5]
MKQNILVVEDEVKLATLLRDYLLQSHFEAHLIHHGDEVLPWLETNSADLILLDIMLPGKDGLTLCREIRQVSNIPIIFVTARIEEIDRLLGLELGADDYVCKPFSPREVVARVKAILRRLDSNFSPAPKGITLDENKMKVLIEGQDIDLTALEFQLLKVMYDRPGHIFSRQRLMDHVYNDQRIVSDRTIDSHIKKLRKKLGSCDCIHSVYGVGYKVES